MMRHSTLQCVTLVPWCGTARCSAWRWCHVSSYMRLYCVLSFVIRLVFYVSLLRLCCHLCVLIECVLRLYYVFRHFYVCIAFYHLICVFISSYLLYVLLRFVVICEYILRRIVFHASYSVVCPPGSHIIHLSITSNGAVINRIYTFGRLSCYFLEASLYVNNL